MKQQYTDETRVVQKPGHDAGHSPRRLKPGTFRSLGRSFLATLISLSMVLSLTPVGAIAQDPTGAAAPTEAPAAAGDSTSTAAQPDEGTTASSSDDEPAPSASDDGDKTSSSDDKTSSSKDSDDKSSSSKDSDGKSSSDKTSSSKDSDDKSSSDAKKTEGATPTPTPTDAPDEDKKPAASKTATAGPVTVTVEVGENVFAEGWTLEAKSVPADDVKDTIATVDPDAQVVTAVDLIVRDKDNNEIGLPEGKTAKVTLSGANAPSDDVAVYRLAGGASRVGTSTATANTQVFSTDTFAPTFAVAAKVAKDDASYPAATFSDSANGVTVNVEAPEGALPEGAKMVVTGVGSDDVKAAVEGAIGGEAVEIKAVDITFTDKDDNKIEPRIPVNVSMSGVSAGENQELHALHIKDGNATEVAETGAGASAATF